MTEPTLQEALHEIHANERLYGFQFDCSQLAVLLEERFDLTPKHTPKNCWCGWTDSLYPAPTEDEQEIQPS